jgi:hypothetical protein
MGKISELAVLVGTLRELSNDLRRELRHVDHQAQRGNLSAVLFSAEFLRELGSTLVEISEDIEEMENDKND